jgi:hypothetical protein
MKTFKLLPAFLLIYVTTFLSYAESIGPREAGGNNLFKIGRSRDANEIIYDINLSSSGKINTSRPISIYWIKKTENGRIEPLTWIQNQYAYGIRFLKVGDERVDFQFVSYAERTFFIKKNDVGIYRVFTNSNNKEVEVNKIFIQIDGGSFWVPTIPRVELFAYDSQNGRPVKETIYR